MSRQPFSIMIILALFLSLLPGICLSDSSRLDENEVKAAYLYNFAKYVDWPSPDGSTVIFCVIGSAPLNISTLLPLAEKPIKNHRIMIRELKHSEDIDLCNLLFINSYSKNSISHILKSAVENSILTVSDQSGFTANGGIIEFIPINNKIRFKINNRVAKQSNIKISSRLLNLATSVIE